MFLVPVETSRTAAVFGRTQVGFASVTQARLQQQNTLLGGVLTLPVRETRGVPCGSAPRNTLPSTSFDASFQWR